MGGSSAATPYRQLRWLRLKICAAVHCLSGSRGGAHPQPPPGQSVSLSQASFRRLGHGDLDTAVKLGANLPSCRKNLNLLFSHRETHVTFMGQQNEDGTLHL